MYNKHKANKINPKTQLMNSNKQHQFTRSKINLKQMKFSKKKLKYTQNKSNVLKNVKLIIIKTPNKTSTISNHE